jgi:putative nucleotidyltransferase with HDIG domain
MFVETQGQVLNRLKTSLRGTHADWQILFMADASAALDLISQRKVGMVLASFGMDNAGCEEFFSSLRKKAPEVIRIGLLPDQAKKNVAKSLEYAHECIAAHRDVSQMESLIARSLYVWEKARRNPRLAELMSNLHTIPTPPAVYFDIRDELESPRGTAHSVAEIIAKDPAITAKLLKVANSGFYTSPRTIADLDDAITLLGMDLVLALVLSAHLYNQLPIPGLKLDKLWKHSIAVATLAKEIASHEQGSRAIISSCAIAGLLHDLGQLVFLANMPDTYYSLIRDARGNETMLLEMELAEFGIGHPELGALILSLWDLPEEVVHAIANHHAKDFRSLPDVSLTTKAVWVAESMLQGHNLQQGTEVTDDTEGQADTPSMFDGLVQWKPLMEKLVEQGLIQPPRDPVETLMG